MSLHRPSIIIFFFSRLKEYERTRKSNQSTYWVVFELLWRDYFRFVVWRHGDRVFYRGGIRGMNDIPWKQDMELFQR